MARTYELSTARSGRATPWTTSVAWGVAALAFVLAAAAVAIARSWSVFIPTYAILIASTYPTFGALIVSRDRRNLVGWLLIGNGLINSLVVLCHAWAPVSLDLAPGRLPGGLFAGQVAAWVADGLWILSHGVFLTLLPLLFPDGRLPSKRWWPVLVFNVSAVGVQFAAPLSVLSQVRLRTSYDEFYPDERLAAGLGEIGYDLVRIAAVLAVASLLWRLSRMPRDERGPYTWFAIGALIGVALIASNAWISHPLANEVVRLTGIVLIPLGAAIAILRRRVYGIDVVVNRALVYAVLTAALAAVYLASVAVVDQFVRSSSTVSAVAAAGAAAIVLSTLREHVQAFVNRLMYGRRDEPHVIASAVTGRLEALTAGQDVLHEVTAEIRSSLRLPYVALEAVTVGGGRQEIAATGERPEQLERVALVARGELVGEMLVSPRRGQAHLSARDTAALREVAPIAAAAVSEALLAEDLRSARGRLTTVLEEERRRIRRDLHDGLGPSLATVVMGLEEALAVHRGDPERTERLLVDLKEQTRESIEEIRSLVYGLRPPALDELGLQSAVRQLVDGTVSRTGIEVQLDVPAELPALAAATEVAAYRIVQEALTNVVRHSGAARATVKLAVDGGHVVVEVSDDGRGLPQPMTPGVGVMSMRERVGDVGGTVTFSGPPGTTVWATLPDARL